jgi:hypothetical protein
VLHGTIPNRNFLHLYGPGSLWALAGAFKVFGVSLLTERVHHIPSPPKQHTEPREKEEVWRRAPDAPPVYPLLAPIGVVVITVVVTYANTRFARPRSRPSASWPRSRSP